MGHQATSETFYGPGLALFGVLYFSTGNVLSSLRQKAGIHPLIDNIQNMLYGTLILLTLYLFQDVPLNFNWSARYVGPLLYLAIPDPVIGFTTCLTLVGRMGPDHATYYTVLFPVMALNISTFTEDYRWTVPALAGLALVMLGSVLMFCKPRAPVPAGLARST